MPEISPTAPVRAKRGSSLASPQQHRSGYARLFQPCCRLEHRLYRKLTCPDLSFNCNLALTHQEKKLLTRKNSPKVIESIPLNINPGFQNEPKPENSPETIEPILLTPSSDPISEPGTNRKPTGAEPDTNTRP
jgi:hypothetical protein